MVKRFIDGVLVRDQVTVLFLADGVVGVRTSGTACAAGVGHLTAALTGEAFAICDVKPDFDDAFAVASATGGGAGLCCTILSVLGHGILSNSVRATLLNAEKPPDWGELKR